MNTLAVGADGELAEASRIRRRKPLFLTALADPRTRVGLVLMAIVIAVALAGPIFAPHSATEFVGRPYAGPSASAPLGTDQLGRDVLSRVLGGGATLLWMSFLAALLGVTFGTTIGVAAAYLGGRVRSVLMRSIDALLAFPTIVLVLLFVSLIGPKPWLIVLLVAIAWTPQVARVTFGVARKVSAAEFVEAAEAIGMPRARLILTEILPNLSTTISIELGLRITWSIGLIAALSFIGFGLQPPAADWGLLVNENRLALTTQPWAIFAPIVLIAVLAVGVNLVTEGLARASARTDGSDTKA